jgi:hypothetical protein
MEFTEVLRYTSRVIRVRSHRGPRLDTSCMGFIISVSVDDVESIFSGSFVREAFSQRSPVI